ncbi:hypothetical protein evm_005672 [Chilo suppressalis]|nr:hypothetical protein evm_005672 [Chilo suppressalis]
MKSGVHSATEIVEKNRDPLLLLHQQNWLNLETCRQTKLTLPLPLRVPSEDHARWPSLSPSDRGHNSNAYKKNFGDSFLCRTIRKWNGLPANVFPPSYNQGSFKRDVKMQHAGRQGEDVWCHEGVELWIRPLQQEEEGIFKTIRHNANSRKGTENYWKHLRCGAGEGWKELVGPRN